MIKNGNNVNYKVLIRDFIAKSAYLATVRQGVILQGLKRQVIPVGIITYGLRYFPVKPP